MLLSFIIVMMMTKKYSINLIYIILFFTKFERKKKKFTTKPFTMRFVTNFKKNIYYRVSKMLQYVFFLKFDISQSEKLCPNGYKT